MENSELIAKAKAGEIAAFHQLFNPFQKELKAYVYRLVTDRSDAEDITHDVFVKAFEKIALFQGRSSLKTWVFSIATHMCIDFLRGRRRWESDSQDRARLHAEASMDVEEALINKNKYSQYGLYEIKEHIDFCFTCMSKTLPIEQQIALILKDMFDFTVKEITEIIKSTVPTVKHYLHDARKTMTIIFDHRCALISKKGICHQCSELNGYFNPKQNSQYELMKLELVKNADSKQKEELFDLRTKLIKHIDPLNAEGSDLHEVFMQLTRKVEGEIEDIDY
ncbi:MAG: RNA polymerase sigma factor [Bacteroidetes bacterium]|nr:RNA polymerase sigma factor [Bacteroidota bacterium]